MLDFKYITAFLFKLSLTLYVVSHAFNIQANPRLYINVFMENMEDYGYHISEDNSAKYLEIYAHLQVIVGCIIFFGWRIGKILLLFTFCLNSLVLCLFEEYDQAIIGLKLLIILLIIYAPIKHEKVELSTKFK